MKAVILAGGLGTRLSEETVLKPKPMVEIGGSPMLWHIMKVYSSYGINEFIICLGYKGYLIKEFFANYYMHTSDVTFDFRTNEMQIHKNNSESWKVTLVDTGEHTLTGGRLKKVQQYVGDEAFCFTYGDGLSDVNILELVDFHKHENHLATVTAVRPPGRFGAFEFHKNEIIGFQEKPMGDGNWINGGFFVLEPEVFDLISGDNTTWEEEPMEKLAKSGELSAFMHEGFWQPMDTLRDKNKLEEMWNTGTAPWKVW
ncbi:glucose-1-phosphate cytidylyltransferase [Paenibacillus sp. FSL H7-0737]|uniref:glucose-1-phosphate cytidylyltransferase n=1 Tax=Paenibacillus sp. FSL H7-0737 TaxID=1536775 RepID=UPI0004F5F06D|nr:glucose-1-phosphate cytidylyltransferase [Paenibacillus sp. FSL H7-0737]AIQ26372.1 glucose-1-phosphate cytidylyltransferase [Paenibacillus sp. FSL H7-0737]